jgi:hypothetical protein
VLPDRVHAPPGRLIPVASFALTVQVVGTYNHSAGGHNIVQASTVHSVQFINIDGGAWPFELNAFLRHISGTVPDFVFTAVRIAGIGALAPVTHLLNVYGPYRQDPQVKQYWYMVVHATGMNPSVEVVVEAGRYVAPSMSDYDFQFYLRAALVRSTPEAARIAFRFGSDAEEMFVDLRTPEELTAYPNILADQRVLNHISCRKSPDEIARIVRILRSSPSGFGRSFADDAARKLISCCKATMELRGLSLHDLRGALLAEGQQKDAKEITKLIVERARRRR